jgi:hypothetical protein
MYFINITPKINQGDFSTFNGTVETQAALTGFWFIVLSYNGLSQTWDRSVAHAELWSFGNYRGIHVLKILMHLIYNEIF